MDPVLLLSGCDFTEKSCSPALFNLHKVIVITDLHRSIAEKSMGFVIVGQKSKLVNGAKNAKEHPKGLW